MAFGKCASSIYLDKSVTSVVSKLIPHYPIINIISHNPIIKLALSFGPPYHSKMENIIHPCAYVSIDLTLQRLAMVH